MVFFVCACVCACITVIALYIADCQEENMTTMTSILIANTTLRVPEHRALLLQYRGINKPTILYTEPQYQNRDTEIS